MGAVGVAFACGACATTSPPVDLRADRWPTARFGAAITLSQTAAEALRQIAGIPGMSVAVGIGDTIVWSEGFGFADAEGGVRVTQRTMFRIASVSKVLTAAAVAKLYEQGALDLDAPVERYVPEWPQGQPTPTVRQLAGHLGGIRDYSKADVENGIDARRYDSVRAALSIFEHDSLVTPPGSAYKYSTFGYVLLSAALEGAAGRDFFSLMEQQVLAPVGMRETVPKLPDRTIPNMTALYAPGEGGRAVRAPDVSPSYKWAAGGYVSTAEDLVRFGLAHLRPGFLKAGTLSTIFTSQRTLEGKETGVGIGWMAARDPWNRRVLFHNGTQTGARSVLLIYPDAGIVVAVLSNLTNTPRFVEGTAMGIAEPFLWEASRNNSSRGFSKLAGTYTYRIGSGDQVATGTLQLDIVQDRLEGWMTTTPGAKPDRLSIPFLLEQDKGVQGVLVAPEGLLLLGLRDVAGNVDATITFHGRSCSSQVTAALVKRE